MMKQGFTLIEIIIVVLISSVLAINLYQTFFSVSRTVTQLTNVIEIDVPLMPLYNQLARDITGIFTPASTIRAFKEEEAKKKKKEPEKTESGSTTKNQKETAQKDQPKATEQKPEQKKEEKIINNVFHVISTKPGQLSLSFISTGGIQILEFDGSIRPVPYIRRIAYILQPDTAQPGTSKLVYRFQADRLDIESIEKEDFLPSYDLLRGIKRLTVEFTVFAVPKDEKEKKQEAVKLKEWNEKEIFSKYRTLIPAYINFRGTYTDRLGNSEHDFEFNFKVPTYSYIKEEDKKKDPKQLFQKLTEFIEEKIPGGKSNEKANAKK